MRQGVGLLQETRQAPSERGVMLSGVGTDQGLWELAQEMIGPRDRRVQEDGPCALQIVQLGEMVQEALLLL